MTTYSSAALGEVNENANPVVADGDGRWPAVFFDDSVFSFYRARVTDADSVLLYDADSQPVIGQIEGSGGAETPVNETQLASTGDMKMKFGTGSESGWVRANGRTIGSASSGATERANADTADLFAKLWTEASNTILAVSGGRGGSAAADYAANKTIVLPDMRGRAPFGPNSMGNSASARIAVGFIDTGGIDSIGSVGGDDDIALITANLAAHTHSDGTLAADAHQHFLVAAATVNDGTASIDASSQIPRQDNSGFGLTIPKTATAATLGLSSTASATGVTGNTASTGSGTAHENMPPFMLVTFYLKL